MRYKTRGDSNPHGKQKVYFSCHPDDFKGCFEDVSNDILKFQDCAIWYCEETMEHNTEEVHFELKQMQLFVIPVTRKFLTENNYSLNFDLKFAIENHIPVLPIMLESGLEDIFNLKCGDLQFVNKVELDLTAIPYQDKLKRYLESVLVGDELAKKVREAFDAYVFLSYRKKDRKYAQELMRLIHKNDFCRDVAIWYDEFLVPGENFNDAIEKMVKESNLFAIAVTPNLVNESNYVMTTEYKLARKDNKPVLPFEMVKTDKSELEKYFDGIPNCTDVHDEKAVSDSLLNALKAIAKEKDSTNIEHNFFIGLAYLNGIDVEVNHEKAVELITSASDCGFLEATKKLVKMYYNGEGVKQDYHKAIELQEKVVEKLEKKVADNENKRIKEEYIDEVYRLGEYYTQRNIYDKAFFNYKKCSDCSQKLEITKDATACWYYILSQKGMGIVCEANNHIDEAMEHYYRCFAILDKLICECDYDFLLEEYTYICINLGDDYHKLKQYDKKEEILKKAYNNLKVKKYFKRNIAYKFLEICLYDCLRENGKKKEAQKIVQVAKRYWQRKIRMGDSTLKLYEKGSTNANEWINIDKIKGYYEESLELADEIMEEDRNDETRKMYLDSLDRLGYISEIEGNYLKAKEYYFIGAMISEGNIEIDSEDLIEEYLVHFNKKLDELEKRLL